MAGGEEAPENPEAPVGDNELGPLWELLGGLQHQREVRCTYGLSYMTPIPVIQAHVASLERIWRDLSQSIMENRRVETRFMLTCYCPGLRPGAAKVDSPWVRASNARSVTPKNRAGCREGLPGQQLDFARFLGCSVAYFSLFGFWAPIKLP